MGFPMTIREQPGLAVQGIVTDANGDSWVLFNEDAHWRKVTKEQMNEALQRFLGDLT